MFLAAGQDTSSSAQSIVVAIAIGVAFIWLLCMGAEVAMRKAVPVLPFLIIAGIVGVLVIKMTGNI